MADTYSANLTLTKPEVGGSTDTWGTKWNANTDVIDSIFKDDGTGRSVGINVGEGKTLSVGGTFEMSDANNETLAKQLMPYIYPVGSLYYNAVDNTNPSDLLGFGTWVAYAGGRVPVGYSEGDSLFGTAEGVYGYRDAVLVGHSHTVSSSTTTSTNGEHTHPVQVSKRGDLGAGERCAINAVGDYASCNTPGASFGNTRSGGSHSHTVSMSGTTSTSGTSATNANIQPSVTVYIWKRTA